VAKPNAPGVAKPNAPLLKKVSQEVGDESPTPPLVEPGRLDAVRARGQTPEVNELFAYWQQQCGHPHARLTPERKARIAARLKQGYTVEQIRQAIDGAACGAFVNEAGKRFDDIELICRSGSKLESFVERARRTATGTQ
jgi:hypothetical protein